jgi:DNA-binding MarR family transcriptional regulator
MRDESTIRNIEHSMTRIARSLGRRDFGRQVERDLGRRVDASFLQVIGAIDELTGPGEAPNVKDIARQLDVHHSRASRVVKDTIRAGLVRRLASQEDARRSPLALSEKGQEIASALHATRAKFFAARLHGFSKADRRNLARLLGRFAESDTDALRKKGESDLGSDASRKIRRVRTGKRRKSAAQGPGDTVGP